MKNLASKGGQIRWWCALALGSVIVSTMGCAVVTSLTTARPSSGSVGAVAERGWQPTPILDAAAAFDAAPRIAIDSAGVVTVVWHEGDDVGGGRIAVERVAAGVSARSPLILSEKGADSRYPDLALAGADLWVTWAEQSRVNSAICARRFVARDSTWQAPQCIGAPGGGVDLAPRLAANSLGDAVMVWRESASAALRVSRLNRQTGAWSKAEQFAVTGLHPGQPVPAIDHQGNVIVVWTDGRDARTDAVLAARFDAHSARWTGAVRLDDLASLPRHSPTVVFDAHGDALIAWAQDEGLSQRPHVSRYDRVSLQYARPVVLESNPGVGGAPALAIDGQGNALAAWSLQDDDHYELRARRYDRLSGLWGEAHSVAEGTAFLLREPRIALDSRGDGLLIWSKLSDPLMEQVFATRFDLGRRAWGEPKQIAEQPRGFGDTLQLDSAREGPAAAAWAGSRAIRVARFQ